MQSQQRYISNELTHLVGNKSVEDLEFQYLKLCKILNDSILTSASGKPEESEGLSGVTIKYGKISRNEMFESKVVCFCDIPVDDLKIHIQKYGYFGLSFRKEFIASKGGAPVFYMPKQRAEEFDKIALGVVDLFRKDSINKTSCEKEDIDRFLFMLEKVFCYFQAFDHMLADDHTKNYYFEREWRVLDRLKFDLKDVRCLFLPEFYAERFHKKFPDYYGQVTFTKEGVQDRPTMKKEIICCKCQHREEVQIPENTTVSSGQVSDEMDNVRGNLICVKCGSEDVDPVLQDGI